MADLVNKNTGTSKRTNAKVVDTKSFNPGPFEAEVVNHLDTSYMGGLEVRLLTKSGSGNAIDTPGETVPVKYLSPFYGVTSNKGITKNSGDQNSQKSYGMWFVPPDVGTRVLVIFAEGGQGYWIGCIQDDYMNMMLPGGNPATTYNDTDPGNALPVGEYNKKTEEGTGRDPTKYIKPANKRDCDILKGQGLDKCRTRGLSTSSARREAPSSVFGISTPGPPDRAGPKVQYGGDFGSIDVPHNRLGGSSIVFDDGDCTLQRKTHPKDGPPEYANVDAGEHGDPTIPHNEMIRLRTRTGHQIIMHNSEDLIYICNSRGTAWIELTSNGKIDIYAQDDFSVHTEKNMNLKADKNIYIEALEEIHVKSGKSTFIHSLEEMHVKSDEDMFINSQENLFIKTEESTYAHALEKFHIKSDEDMFVNSKENIFIKSDESTFIDTLENLYVKCEKGINMASNKETNLTSKSKLCVQSDGDVQMKSQGDMNMETSGNANITTSGTLNQTVGSDMNLSVSGSGMITTSSDLNLSGSNIKQSASGNIEESASNIIFSSSNIDINGASTSSVPSAAKASSADSAAPSLPAKPADPSQDATDATEVQRIPLKEPWEEHENLHGAKSVNIPDTFKKGK